MTTTNAPSQWIPELSRTLRIDPMGIKLEALRQCKRLGITYRADMTEAEAEAIQKAITDVFTAIRKG